LGVETAGGASNAVVEGDVVKCVVAEDVGGNECAGIKYCERVR
jgi:hypothetical protein